MNEALRLIIEALRQLGIPFFAGGSVASSIHGIPRFTRDVDLVAQMEPRQVRALASLVSTAFYVDELHAEDCVRRGRAFNLIHLGSASKIDIFPVQPDGFHASELSRATEEGWLTPGGETVRLPVASAEDTVLSKLVWYEQGGRVSDHQWGDLLGIAGRTDLDQDYLRRWAPELGVTELLERLLGEAR